MDENINWDSTSSVYPEVWDVDSSPDIFPQLIMKKYFV